MFILSLTSTPYMAYLAEPLPGSVEAEYMPTWSSYEEYVNVSTIYFQLLYNNSTMCTNAVSRRDTATNTFGMRLTMVLPFEIPDDEDLNDMISMPAAPYYGKGTVYSSFSINLLNVQRNLSESNEAVENLPAQSNCRFDIQ
ncbi:hypothetical protein AeMF1_019213 [Aphanomyces euteiches]|nr:hypothetical protein AeMF1_019213 [Aphanomyces euteiches]KAH9186359.1 hypothetical protein AeNC1_011665 [Aphanomyces euteiches]